MQNERPQLQCNWQVLIYFLFTPVSVFLDNLTIFSFYTDYIVGLLFISQNRYVKKDGNYYRRRCEGTILIHLMSLSTFIHL